MIYGLCIVWWSREEDKIIVEELLDTTFSENIIQWLKALSSNKQKALLLFCY